MTENKKIFKTGELLGKKDTWGDTNTIIGHMNTLNTKNAGTQDKKYRSMGYTHINLGIWSKHDNWDYVESDMRNKVLVLFQNA